MLLTLSTTRSPATDLGYLLHKNPARVQSFDLSFGKAHVFYPQADERRCTAALLLDVDPVWLVRGRKGPAGEAGTLDQYVNDRPYVASSLMSVAIADLVARKLEGPERGTLPEAEMQYHETEYHRLRAELEEAGRASNLPEVTSARAAMNDLLVRVRMGAAQR